MMLADTYLIIAIDFDLLLFNINDLATTVKEKTLPTDCYWVEYISKDNLLAVSLGTNAQLIVSLFFYFFLLVMKFKWYWF